MGNNAMHHFLVSAQEAILSGKYQEDVQEDVQEPEGLGATMQTSGTDSSKTYTGSSSKASAFRSFLSKLGNSGGSGLGFGN